MLKNIFSLICHNLFISPQFPISYENLNFGTTVFENLRQQINLFLSLSLFL